MITRSMPLVINSLIPVSFYNTGKRKNKKRTRKSFTKGREDGNINGHSTRETSERTLKTEQERIKHNVNESLEINRKQKKELNRPKLSEEIEGQWRV